jgi:capsule polysaccharide export protein KpsE/RkpR
MEYKDNLLGVVGTLYRWRKTILGLCTIVGIGSMIFSWFLMDNYYQATTVFYAASPDQFKPEQIFGTSTKDMDFYGDDYDVDRILTIANSSELAEHLVRDFNLYRHYDIDTTLVLAPFKVQQKLSGLYTVQKNKYNAIELSVEDKDKELSAKMANSARQKIDAIAGFLIKKTQSKLIEAYDANIKGKELYLTALSDTLKKLRERYGIYDLKSQSEIMATLVSGAEATLSRNKAKYEYLRKEAPQLIDSIAMLKANINGLEQELQALTDPASTSNFNLKRYNEGYGPVELLTEIYQSESSQLSEDKERHSQLKTAFESPISAIHLVEEAKVPLIKSRPKRSLLVVGSVFLTFILSVIGVLLLDSYKNVDWKEVFKK